MGGRLPDGERERDGQIVMCRRVAVAGAETEEFFAELVPILDAGLGLESASLHEEQRP